MRCPNQLLWRMMRILLATTAVVAVLSLPWFQKFGLLTHLQGGSTDDLTRKYLDYLHHQKIVDKRKDNPGYSVAEGQKFYDRHRNEEEWIASYFNGKRNGTFIEAGGHDGVNVSNTLLLEVEYGWSGLLVEVVPHLHAAAVASKRKAMFLGSCLSPYTYPSKLAVRVPSPTESVNTQGAHLADPSVVDGALRNDHANPDELEVDCYPLYDIMLAAGLTTLDVLMLDVEGAELSILRTLPWSLVDIKLIQMENKYLAFNETDMKEKAKRFHEEAMFILIPRGYTFDKREHGLDLIFLKTT